MKKQIILVLCLLLSLFLTACGTGTGTTTPDTNNAANDKNNPSSMVSQIMEKDPVQNDSTQDANTQNNAPNGQVGGSDSTSKESVADKAQQAVDDVVEKGKNATDKVMDETTDAVNKITAEQAKTKAFAHAGVNANNAKNVRVEKDYDDGRQVYDIGFYADGVEYDYEIDAQNGNIVSYDREGKKIANTSNVTNNQTLTAEQAKAKAFDHAGVTEKTAKGVTVEKDREDGRTVYEIEFHADGFEYNYEINAADGKIIAHEKDFD
jgi:uncharacterized membrane protein YkoI